jgi:hypothetical protein
MYDCKPYGVNNCTPTPDFAVVVICPMQTELRRIGLLPPLPNPERGGDTRDRSGGASSGLLLSDAAGGGSSSSGPIAHSALLAASVNGAPIDPNEPLYCVCRQVSYGEMIGCDDPDCEFEWFHLKCVKLSKLPSGGSWLCPVCTAQRRAKAEEQQQQQQQQQSGTA